MEKEIDTQVIKDTQTLLGKYVKRPALTEKLLKKPPFRFLHDIFTTVQRNTGFFEGLFDEQELNSENVKDRESKILFLNKVITVVGLTLDKKLTVKSSKIVAGQEPVKTNELLQCLAQALDKNLSSLEAVKKVKGIDKPQREKTSDTKINGTKKNNPKVSDSGQKKEKISISKTDLKTEKKSNQQILKKQKSKDISKTKDSNTQENKELNQDISKDNLVTSDSSENIKSQKDTAPEDKENSREELELLNTDLKLNLENSSNIIDNEILTLPSEDLLIKGNANLNEIDNVQTEDLISIVKDDVNILGSTHSDNNSDIDQKLITLHHNGDLPFTKEVSPLVKNDSQENTNQQEHPRPSIRPSSVRPSSSRPGAPRPKEKHENILDSENLLVGKVNIIVENAAAEEDEDSSILVVDHHESIMENQEISHDQNSSKEHGVLVHQILESHKELSQKSGKTEIEWELGTRKAREAVNQEIENLRFNIQAVSRVANPLGKLLDHIQEDVEVMRQELHQWKNTHNESKKELQKQKMATEEFMFPLQTKLKQLNMDITDKHEKINDLRIIIQKNAMRVERLLAMGIVQ